MDQGQEYEQQDARIRDRASRIKHQVLILSGKGGVGKSTVAANLAFSLASDGGEVGLLDADLHGPSAALMTGQSDARAFGTQDGIAPVPVWPNLHLMSMALLLEDAASPVIWRGPMRANVLRQFIGEVAWPELDWLIIDLPPGTGDEPLTVAQALPEADGAVVVTTPQEASLVDCRKAIRFVQQVGLPVLGVIENMSGFVCPHCGETTDVFLSGGGEAMAVEMGVPFLGRVPLHPQVCAASDLGGPAFGPGAPPEVQEAIDGIVAGLTAPLRAP